MVAQAKSARPNVVNGINVDDLFALIDGVKRDAAKAKTNWHVSTTWRGQTRSRSQVEGFEHRRGTGAAPVLDRHRRTCELAERTSSPIRRSICCRRSTPASWWVTWRSARCTGSPSKA